MPARLGLNKYTYTRCCVIDMFFYYNVFSAVLGPSCVAGVNESFHMGDLMEGTYCSRIFSNCDKKRCVLQSPNYPGLYPRNLTCYYAIRQHSIPYGHQALISITQPYSRLVSIKTDRTNPEGADPKPVERKVCDDGLHGVFESFFFSNLSSPLPSHRRNIKTGHWMSSHYEFIGFRVYQYYTINNNMNLTITS